MGTKNCPETPRQKMINMMYLVLTAMLALNVAAETLDAFKIVDKSLMKTFENFTAKNESLYSDFERKYTLNPNKVQKWYKTAEDVGQLSDTLISYITEVKEELIHSSEGKYIDEDEELHEREAYIITREGDTLVMVRQDDLNVSPEVMLTKGRGADLKEKINEFKNFLITKVDTDNTKLIKTINSSLDVSDPDKDEIKDNETIKQRTWEASNFEATPLVASITLLSKLQIDVRNAESAVISYLYNQIDAESFKFNKLKARVIAESDYVLQGEEYRAKVFLSAEDTTRSPEIYVNNNKLSIENGMGIFTSRKDEPGIYTFNGTIKYQTPDGGFKKYNFEEDYEVAAPSFTVAPTKMNVLYLNVDNPISISAPGISKERLIPELTNGELIKDENGGWIAKPGKIDVNAEETEVIVWVEDDETNKRSLGNWKFRVKEVPDPEAEVANQRSGSIERELLGAEVGVFANMPQDFDFNLKFMVTKFQMAIPGAGGSTVIMNSDSYRFTADMKEQIADLRPGTKVVFEDIYAKIVDAENARERKLDPIVLTIR